MLNLVSLTIGVVALVFVVIAFLPFLGLLNWFVIPLAIIGAAIGAMSSGGRAGLNLNVLVIVVGTLRLILGGGIL